MNILSYVPEIRVDKEIGYGANGNVYSILNDNRVIKFCKMYDLFDGVDLQDKYDDVDSVLSYIEDNNPHVLGRAYAHKYVGMFERKQIYYEQDRELFHNQQFIIYYYIMERLNKLSDDEKKIFHSILSHEDMNYKKNYSIDKIGEMLDGMGCAFDFDKCKVVKFCEDIRVSSIHHKDIHPRNIMKDNLGNFKLIDLDSCEIKGGGNE